VPVQVRPSAPRPSSNKLGRIMEIAELRIHGFRGVQDARVRLRLHAVFIGPNNCGKTTIIEALALLFGRDRLIRDLTEHDFFGSDPAPPDRISIVATIAGFDANDPNRHPNWFREDRAVFMTTTTLKTFSTRKLLSEYRRSLLEKWDFSWFQQIVRGTERFRLGLNCFVALSRR
jgi:predicted ATP-dependent endonuclease of OLD family